MFWVLCQFIIDSGAGVISYIILTLRLQHDCSKGLIGFPQIRKWPGRKNSSRSGKSQVFSIFWVRENWNFEEKSGRIEIHFITTLLIQFHWRLKHFTMFLCTRYLLKTYKLWWNSRLELRPLLYVAFYTYLVPEILFLNREKSGNVKNWSLWKPCIALWTHCMLIIFLTRGLQCVQKATAFSLFTLNFIALVIVQERLTKQIAMALTEAVNPAGVGVVIEATWVLVGVAKRG